MVQLLPERLRYDDTGLLVRLVGMCQELASSHLAYVDQLEHVIDPAVAPDAMVRLMGRWIGLEMLDPSLDEGLQRQVVLGMAELVGWPGTRRRLQRLLELVVQGPVEIDDSGGIHREGDAPRNAPEVRIRVQSIGWLRDEEVLREMIEAELPASVTYHLQIADVGGGEG